MAEKKRAVLYGRVSTSGQNTDSQFVAMRDYAKQNGFKIIDEISDTFTGNSPLADRPGGAKVYSYLKRKATDAVILYTLDRVARDDEALEYGIFKRDVNRAGAELHFTDTGKAADDLFGGMIEQFKAMGAADERRKIRERMTRGKNYKAGELGKWVGNGAPPYGYRKIGKKNEAQLVIDESEAAIITRIYDMYLGMNGYRPTGLARIAKAFTTEGVKAPTTFKETSRWWGESVRNILNNRAYIGEFHYAQHSIELPQLAIVKDNLWEAAQKRKKKNTNNTKRNRRYDYLLAGGYIRCSCGGGMICANMERGRYFYYKCWKRSKDHLYTCRQRYVRADKTDAIVWKWLSDVLSDDHNLEVGLNRMVERREIELSPKRNRLKAITELIDQYEQQAKNLAGGLAKAKNETVIDALNIELDRVGKALSDLVEERDLLVAYIGQGEFTPEEVVKIKFIASELREELDSPDFETKRYVIDKLNLRAELRHDDHGRWLDVTCGLKLDTSSLSIETSDLTSLKRYAKLLNANPII